MKDLFKSRYDDYLLILIHLSFLFILYSVLSFFGFIAGYPSDENLIQFDVGWYKKIAEEGYSFVQGEQSNTAFFPLYPLIWRWLGLSPVFISILNMFFWLLGMILLKRTFKINSREFLLFLSIPSMFFCFVPFSEALFFLSGAIFLYGMKRNIYVAITGLFLLGLCRSVSLVFVPVIIFTLAYNLQPRNRSKNLGLLKNMSLLIITSIVSLLVAQLIQYNESGTFFTLFKTQEAWSRVMSWPSLYLTTWDGSRLIWLDGLAFFVGLAAIIICVMQTVRKLKNPLKKFSAPILFSVSFVAITALVVLFYSPKDDATGGTSLMSMNRYIFASPFFVVLLHMIWRSWRPNKTNMIKFIVLSGFVWFLFNAFGFLYQLDHFALPYFKTKLYFGIITLYSLMFFLNSRAAYQTNLWSGLYVFNMIVQIFLIHQYINATWIG